MSKYPQRLKNVTWRPLEDLYLLLNQKNNKIYKLDELGFLVWVQCDGQTDIEEMVDIFSAGDNRDIVRSTVLNVLEKLKKSELIF